jgi:hypothetical protein
MIGFGDLGKQYLIFLKALGYDSFNFFDDQEKKIKTHGAFNFDEYKKRKFEDSEFYVSLGYNHLELKFHSFKHLH